MLRLGDERRLDAQFHRAVGMFADHGEQLDDVAEIFGEMDVGRADLLDAGDVDRRGIDGKSVGERGEQDRLVGGVPAIHIERRIRLGVAERLGLGERGLEGQPGIGHAAENVVRGAVDDAGERMDLIANERVLHGPDDRDATGDGGLEMDRRVHFPGNGEQLDTALGEQRLVSGDHRFLRTQGGGDDFKRIRRAADEFDDDVHARIRDEGLPVGGENFRSHLAGRGADLREVADEDFRDVQGHAATGASGDQFAVTLQDVPDAGTDGSESGQADAKG